MAPPARRISGEARSPRTRAAGAAAWAHRWFAALLGAAAASGLPLRLLTAAQRAGWPWLGAGHEWLGFLAGLPLVPTWTRHRTAFARGRGRADGFALSGTLAAVAAVLAWVSGLALELPRTAPPWLAPFHGLCGIVAAGAALMHVLTAWTRDA
ncbi:MAG: hypothetical protein IRZ18_00550 [Clostridia bacterium]|nr:hypothetical protein [Clostridia bacterium]